MAATVSCGYGELAPNSTFACVCAAGYEKNALPYVFKSCFQKTEVKISMSAIFIVLLAIYIGFSVYGMRKSRGNAFWVNVIVAFSALVQVSYVGVALAGDRKYDVLATYFLTMGMFPGVIFPFLLKIASLDYKMQRCFLHMVTFAHAMVMFVLVIVSDDWNMAISAYHVTYSALVLAYGILFALACKKNGGSPIPLKTERERIILAMLFLSVTTFGISVSGFANTIEKNAYVPFIFINMAFLFTYAVALKVGAPQNEPIVAPESDFGLM